MNKAILLMAFLLLTLGTRAQRFAVDTLSMTGKIDQRINMVFLGDGYREEQLDKFITDVQWMMDALFAKPPYSQYRDYFNCFAIKVPSVVEGAANDPDSLINNYFGSTFNYAGIWRLVVPVRSNLVFQVVTNNFPEYDQVFMIVNDTRYGGSGGWISTSTVHADGPEICIHELGHSFAGLSDEYWAGEVYARENVNMTQESDPTKVKWKNWLNFSSTGFFPHSESPSWFRPHQNCEMRYLNRQFCPVCKEQTVSRILDLTSPILEFAPASENPVMLTDTDFKVNLLPPTPNTLKIWWELNRNEIAVNTDSLNLALSSLAEGDNKLTCFIIDTTSFIRDPSHSTAHLHKVTWEISNGSSGTNFQVVSDKISVSVFPNPAAESVTVRYQGQLPSDEKLKVFLMDLSGKQISTPVSIRINGFSNEFPFRLPRKNLTGGLYYLVVQSADHQVTLPLMIDNKTF
jgi:hypothetical protein